MELNSYDPVTISMPDMAVIDDSETEKRFQAILSQIPNYQEMADQNVAKGDKIQAIITMKENGVVMKGFDSVKLTITVGDGFLPQGLTDGLIGMSVGETKDYSFNFSACGSEDENDASSKMDVSAEIISIRKRMAPVLDDDWVRRNIPRATSVAEMRQNIANELRGNIERKYDEMKRERCAYMLSQRLEDQPDAEEIVRATEGLRSNFEASLMREGKTFQQKLAEMGTTEEQLEEMFVQQGSMVAAQGQAIRSMAEHYGIEVTDEEVLQYAKKSTHNEEEAIKRLEAEDYRKRMEDVVRLEKALTRVCDEAVIVIEESQDSKPQRPFINPFK